MRKTTLALFFVFVATASAAPQLFAQTHVWVDPRAGDDGNSGSSASDAFRTIHHALGQVQSPGTYAERFVHLLPGIFSGSSGESFPLRVESGTVLVGEEGAAQTRIAAAGEDVLDVRTDSAAPVRLSGLTISGARVGVEVEPIGATIGTLLMKAVTVESCASIGVSVELAHLNVSDCVVRNVVGAGIYMLANTTNTLQFDLRDSTIESCGTGVSLLGAAQPGRIVAEIERTRIVRNAGIGVAARIGAAYYILAGSFALSDSLIADNGLHGVGWIDVNQMIPRSIESCTITGNGAQSGSYAYKGVYSSSSLRSSIVAGNADDLGYGATQGTIESCLIGDGDGAGANGNLAGDPLFVDAVAGDLRLRYDSPCVDAGLWTGARDLSGGPRGQDGDLDLLVRPDMGAFELRPLGGPAQVAVGDSYELEVHGPALASYQLIFSRTGLAPLGRHTPFGAFALPAGTSTLIAVGPTTGTLGATVSLFIPAVPALAGDVYAFQSLVRNPSAPGGAAWTNTHVLQVIP